MPKPIKSPTSAKTGPSGKYEDPILWVEPFPASCLAENGKEETVFVRARLVQDVILNGKMYKAGVHTLPCNFAHQHSNVLTSLL